MRVSFLILLSVIYFTNAVNGLRFSHKPVTVDTEVIIVGRPVTLSCNFVKLRAESVREISWFAGYTGFRSKIFNYSPSTGQKDGSIYSFIKTDADSATESTITLTLTEFREPNMTFSCEVESLRDDGYGKLRHYKKTGESKIPVVNAENHELVLKHDPVQGRKISVGEPLSITCISRGAFPPPQLTLIFGSQNVTEYYGGSVKSVSTGSEKEVAIEGKMEKVPMSMFRSGFINVECQARYDNFVFDKKEMTLSKRGSNSNSDMYDDRRWQGSSPAGFASQWPENNRRSWDDSRNNENQDQNNYTPSGYSGSNSGYDSSNTQGYRRGKDIPDFDAEVVHRNDVIHAKLMDLVDPSRVFAGYLIMTADSIDDENTHDSSFGYVNLYGEVPYDVMTSLQRNYGRVNQLTGEKTRIRMEPAKVLNMLGALGYRVTGTAQHGSRGFMWTLERRNFSGTNEL